MTFRNIFTMTTNQCTTMAHFALYTFFSLQKSVPTIKGPVGWSVGLYPLGQKFPFLP